VLGLPIAEASAKVRSGPPLPEVGEDLMLAVLVRGGPRLVTHAPARRSIAPDLARWPWPATE